MPTKTTPKPKNTEPVTPAPEQEQPQDLPHAATIDLIDVAPSSVIERRVKLTDTAMMIAPETTFEEAVSLYDFTHTIRERGRWWLGDIVNFMEDHFPEKYSQAIDLSGLSYSRLTTICSVCRRIEPSRRRQEVSFTWHEKVAYLPSQSADYLLDRGIKEKWTNEQFEDSVARAKGEPTKAEKKAAKEAKPGSTAAKVAASGKTPQIPEGEKPLIWNGYPLRVMIMPDSTRVILQGDELLQADEADRAAHENGHAHGPNLAKWLEEHNFIKGGDEPCETQNAHKDKMDSVATAPIPTAPSTDEAPVSSNGAAPNATESAPTPDPLGALWNQDAPDGQCWKCPDCNSWATLGGNAAFHVTNAKHGMPSLVPIPAQATPPASPEPPKPVLTPLQRAEEAIRAFNAAVPEVTDDQWAEIGANKLLRLKWLENLLFTADSVIDKIQSHPLPARK